MTTTNPLLVFANLAADRERRIADYQSHHNVGRWEAAMAADRAATDTTNWKMLKMIGIDPGTASLASTAAALTRPAPPPTC